MKPKTYLVKFKVDAIVEADTPEEAEDIVAGEIQMMTELDWDSYTIDDPIDVSDDLDNTLFEDDT